MTLWFFKNLICSSSKVSTFDLSAFLINDVMDVDVLVHLQLSLTLSFIDDKLSSALWDIKSWSIVS